QPRSSRNCRFVRCRRRGAPAITFDRECRTLDCCQYLYILRALNCRPRLGEDTVETVVISRWIMMREANSLGVCGATQGQCVLHCAVPPTNLLRILLSRELRIMNDEVSSREKFAMLQIFADDITSSVC